ncbi:hypothetical protein [Azospirillum argentinense]
MTERYLFGVNLDEEGNAKMLQIFSSCIIMAKESGSSLTIFTPIIKDFRSTFFARAIGDNMARNLVNKKSTEVLGVTIKLASATTIRTNMEKGIILGLWCSQDMLDTLDHCTYAKGIFVASYNPAEVSAWAGKHGIVMQ